MHNLSARLSGIDAASYMQLFYPKSRHWLMSVSCDSTFASIATTHLGVLAAYDPYTHDEQSLSPGSAGIGSALAMC
jgi:hypothetical protein